MTNSVIEALAALEHEQWMTWSKSIVEAEVVSPKRYKRWVPLWVPYSELSEEMKERDREWARKALKICKDAEWGQNQYDERMERKHFK
jgi:hypothetical protein